MDAGQDTPNGYEFVYETFRSLIERLQATKAERDRYKAALERIVGRPCIHGTPVCVHSIAAAALAQEEERDG